MLFGCPQYINQGIFFDETNWVGFIYRNAMGIDPALINLMIDSVSSPHETLTATTYRFQTPTGDRLVPSDAEHPDYYADKIIKGYQSDWSTLPAYEFYWSYYITDSSQSWRLIGQDREMSGVTTFVLWAGTVDNWLKFRRMFEQSPDPIISHHVRTSPAPFEPRDAMLHKGSFAFVQEDWVPDDVMRAFGPVRLAGAAGLGPEPASLGSYRWWDDETETWA